MSRFMTADLSNMDISFKPLSIDALSVIDIEFDILIMLTKSLFQRFHGFERMLGVIREGFRVLSVTCGYTM